MAAWGAIRHFTMDGPIVSILLVRNAFGFVLAVSPIVSGFRGLAELKKHPGYSTGFLRAILGISIGIGFAIAEIVTCFLIVSLMLQLSLL